MKRKRKEGRGGGREEKDTKTSEGKGERGNVGKGTLFILEKGPCRRDVWEEEGEEEKRGFLGNF